MRSLKYFSRSWEEYEGMGSVARGIGGLSCLMSGNLGGHLDTTFRGWSATLAARFVWLSLVWY